MSTWSDTLAVFDLETTGIDVETSRIVTATVAVINVDGVVLERTDWLLDPVIDIPEQATNVHGITTEHARQNGQDAATGVGEIVAALRSALERSLPLVAYNAPYDLTLLNREAMRHGILPLLTPSPVIDPLVIDKAVDRYRKGKRTLSVTSAFYGVDPRRRARLRCGCHRCRPCGAGNRPHTWRPVARVSRRAARTPGDLVRRAGSQLPGLHASRARPGVHCTRRLARALS